MIGLDTNVLVRHLAQDDPTQSALATELLERRLTPEEPGFVSAVVMVELAWVLERRYGLSALPLSGILEQLYRSLNLVFDHDEEVGDAIFALAEGRASFADALIGALARAAGCAHTVTFDRKAQRMPDFRPI